MKFIEVTVNNYKQLLNARHIIEVHPSNSGASGYIVVKDNGYSVSESYEEIKEMLKNG